MGKEGGTFDLTTLRGVGFEDDGYKGPAPFGPYNYLPTKVIHATCPFTPHYILPIHPINTSCQHILSIQPFNTPYQHIMSLHPINTLTTTP